MRPLRRAPRQLAEESGFTLLLALAIMVTTGLLMAAAFTAANGDIHLSHNDQLQKKAYYAAQAGISDYAFHLNQDVNYWTLCKNVPLPGKVNDVGDAPLKTRLVPGTTDESYAIQLITASSDPQAAPQKCDPLNPVLSMIESNTPAGTFRIQSTGYAGNEVRTVTASFGHTSFLNYIYYTKFETSDPSIYADPAAHVGCAAPRSARPGGCNTIDFITGDDIQGPMHTEDSAAICGSPIFGRNPADVIEFKGGSFGNGCPNAAIYKGTLVAAVPTIVPPPSDSSLLAVTQSAYHYTGKTLINLHGSTMDVTNGGSTTLNVAFPSNGVIYISNGTCSTVYTPYGPDTTNDTGCGNVYVHGSYTTPLTIAAENDVVIDGNVTTPTDASGTPTTNGVLGLIANNFVRVNHPINGRLNAGSGNCASDTNGAGTTNDITIYAAILAVNHSFINDNFDCGNPTGNLTVYGAIAQIFRGTVGTHSGATITSGYFKDYIYDDRLQVESPPYFLNPVDAAWHVRRETLSPNP
ncbi:MAG TPA: hypothetical protein VLJ42_01110 [Solirubrobacteraceae bacterium]|nr:hypothetical protein [Solirubrobacteraceae bacterium]